MADNASDAADSAIVMTSLVEPPAVAVDHDRGSSRAKRARKRDDQDDHDDNADPGLARVCARPPADRTRFAVLKVRELQERGELAACVDPEAMWALLIAVANGLALQVTVDPDGAALEAMAGQFASLLLAARRP